MKNVRICFGRWNNLRSKFIRWLTRSKWSHVWIEYNSSIWKDTIVIHVDLKGVIIEGLDNFHKRRGIPSSIIHYKVIKGNLSSGFAKCTSYLGKKYGYWTLFRNSVLLLLRRIGFKNLKPASDSDKFTCSEFVTLLLKHSNVHACNLVPEHTWPGLLAEHFNANSDTFKEVLQKNA